MMYFDKVLQSAIHHRRPEKRVEMIHILGELRDDRALDALKNILTEPDIYIVSEAAMAIGKIGGATAVELLKTVMNHPSFLVRGKVALSIGMINNTERDCLLNQLTKDKNPYVVRCALLSLNNSHIGRTTNEQTA
jgi:HEAT repeat protein